MSRLRLSCGYSLNFENHTQLRSWYRYSTRLVLLPMMNFIFICKKKRTEMFLWFFSHWTFQSSVVVTSLSYYHTHIAHRSSPSSCWIFQFEKVGTWNVLESRKQARHIARRPMPTLIITFITCKYVWKSLKMECKKKNILRLTRAQPSAHALSRLQSSLIHSDLREFIQKSNMLDVRSSDVWESNQ